MAKTDELRHIPAGGKTPHKKIKCSGCIGKMPTSRQAAKNVGSSREVYQMSGTNLGGTVVVGTH